MTTSIDSKTVATGLHFGEGLRWHEGQLWLSDMHRPGVIRLDSDGQLHSVITVDNRPSGLGWLPNGDLLVVSMVDRRLLRWDGQSLCEYANLSGLAQYYCNDMVVDRKGRAYVGNFGFDFRKEEPRPTELILVDLDGSARVAADGLVFPNGAVIIPDDKTLIVAETFAGRLTAFDIKANGDLHNRRVWAPMPEGVYPDGICLDIEGGIWTASPTTNECIRQVEGGEVTHRVNLKQGAFCCALAGHSLYIATAASSEPDYCRQNKSGTIEIAHAPYPEAGRP